MRSFSGVGTKSLRRFCCFDRNTQPTPGRLPARENFILKGKKRMKSKFQKTISVLLLLAMALAIPPTAYAGSTQDFTNSETYLRTSYSNDNYVELSISGNTLTVSGKLLMDGLTGLMVTCGEQSRKYIDATSGQAFSTRVSLSHRGVLPIVIYTQEGGKSTYWSYIWDRIFVEKTSSGYRIMPSLVLDRNLSFTQAYVDPDNFRDSSQVPDSVKSLSNQIAGGETNDYAKIFLLHKWVAENIYYDYDAYYSGENTFYDSAEILANKRSVCEGYANLLRDLILAQGIPCMKASTYALGVGSNGGSFAVKADNAAIDDSNHAHVEAWVDEHWVIMDATWDSNNKYENGAYNTDEPNGFYYFDITAEAFSLDHKYITRANGKLKMQYGAITGADDAVSSFTDVPADAYCAVPVAWAVANKITSGTGGNKFSPAQDCTNAQILTFIWRAYGKPEPTIDNPFANSIPDGYKKAAVWAYEKGMVSGITFDADKPCSRAMAMTYLWQAAGSPAAPAASFTDVSADAACAPAVAWAVEQKITTGTGNGTTFSPDDICNRGQIMTFLHRNLA